VAVWLELWRLGRQRVDKSGPEDCVFAELGGFARRIGQLRSDRDNDLEFTHSSATPDRVALAGCSSSDGLARVCIFANDGAASLVHIRLRMEIHFPLADEESASETRATDCWQFFLIY
jgi:hypothetical protein